MPLCCVCCQSKQPILTGSPVKVKVRKLLFNAERHISIENFIQSDQKRVELRRLGANHPARPRLQDFFFRKC